MTRLLDKLLALLAWTAFGFALVLGAPCDAASILVDLAYRSGNPTDAKRAYLRARELARKNQCADASARSAVGLAYVLLGERDVGRANEVLAPEMTRIRALNDVNLLAEALLKIGTISYRLGDPKAAMTAWREAADISRAAKYDSGYAAAIFNLGGVAFDGHDDEEARRYWLEALELSRKRRDLLKVAEVQLLLGILAMRSGDIHEARPRFIESRTIYIRHRRPELAEKAASLAANAEAPTDS